MLVHKLSVLTLALLIQCNAHGQKFKWLKVENDTTYITDLTEDLTIRAYLANKFNRYTPGDDRFSKKLSYMANDNYNIGVGFNYKYVGINFSSKVPLLNNDVAKYGETKFLDLQSFFYLRKIILDMYYLSYNGYYMSSRAMVNVNPATDAYPQRPDLKTRNIGLNLQYILNNRRFSFRAAFLQNEYQKKSSGSAIVGAGLHFVRVRADSAIVPANINYAGYFGDSRFTGSNIIVLGLNAGYAHTLVIRKHYFVTACLLGGGGVNYTSTNNKVQQQTDKVLSVQLNSIVRCAAGYNSIKYFAGIHYINFINRNNAPPAGTWQEFQAGNIRLTFVDRFILKKEMKKRVNKFERDVRSELGIPHDASNPK